jgi:hypothetical protein
MTPQQIAQSLNRRSERVFLRIPIAVHGIASNGKPFAEYTFTIVINRHGARIALKASVQPGDELTLTNLSTLVSCPFRVVSRVYEIADADPPEWGVECLQPDLSFWGIEFPQVDGRQNRLRGIDALLECSGCQSRQLAQLTLEEYRHLTSNLYLRRRCAVCDGVPDWTLGVIEAAPGEPASGELGHRAGRSEADQNEARAATRIIVKLPVRVRLLDGREQVVRSENLSDAGLCFASELEMKEGEIVQLTVGYVDGQHETEVPARIVWIRKISKGALYGVRLLRDSDPLPQGPQA